MDKLSLEEAIRISATAHEGQVDKSGVTYLLHPLRVMLNCQTNDERIVAILHDVLEDTDLTEQYLKMIFPERIVQAVVAITKQDHETNQEYIKRCKKDPIARNVKFADITDNLAPIRQANLDQHTQERLLKKYKKSLKWLLE